jgi:AAA family ATP:ADP antiporter
MASKLMAAQLQPADMFLLAAAGLLVCIGLNYCVARRAVGHAPESAGGNSEPLRANSGFRLVLADRYLRLIAALAVLVSAVNSTGEYLLGRLVAAQTSRAIAEGTAGAFSQSQLIGIFYGDFFGWVNFVSLLIQILVVSRLFKRIGVGGALFVLPLLACGNYALLVFLPLLDAVRVGKILENSTDYSLQNTARHALYLQTSREAKFKAKQAIDSLSCRVGDLLQAGLVFVGGRLAFGVRQFALLNEVFVILWIVVVICIYREHKRQALVQGGTAGPA